MRHHHIIDNGVIGHDGHTHEGPAGIVLETNEEIPWVLHYHLNDGKLVEHGGHIHHDPPSLLLFYNDGHNLTITSERQVSDEPEEPIDQQISMPLDGLSQEDFE